MTRRKLTRKKGGGGVTSVFSLVELLVVVAIVSLLMSLLLPALSKAKLKAGQISCSGNLRQLLTASAGYTQDYYDYIEPAFLDLPGFFISWTGLLGSYLGRDSTTFASAAGLPSAVCPMSSQRFGYGHNYAYLGWTQGGNKVARKLASVSKPSDTVHFTDNINTLAADPADFSAWRMYSRSGGAVLQDVTVYFVHSGMANVGWMDGHVAPRKAGDGLVNMGGWPTDIKWWGRPN